MKVVKWHIDNTFHKETINELERLWKIKFTEKYINVVIKHDGAQPDVVNDFGQWCQGLIEIPKWHGKFAGLAFLRYTNVNIIERTNIVMTYNAFKECLPEPNKIFPFAIDGAGNIFFFDYRKDENEPSILFLDHERAVTEEDLTEEELDEKPVVEWLEDNLYYVSNSFEDLLNLIRPLE